MKKNTKNLLIVGAIALGAYFLLKKNSVSASGGSGGGLLSAGSGLQDAAVTLGESGAKQSTTSSQYAQAVNDFINAPINTPSSIQSGVNVINTALAEGVQLPRLSSTTGTGYTAQIGGETLTGNIAKLASGTSAFVSVSPAKTDAQGQTNLDKIIAKNKAK